MFKRQLFMIGMVVLTTNSAVAEPVLFHSQVFADQATVSLFLSDPAPSGQFGGDVKVTVALSRSDDQGHIFADQGRHVATVRCAAPAKVTLRGRDFLIDDTLTAAGAKADWKLSLWRAVCAAPLSS